MTYRVRVSGEVEIQAENVAQAARVAKSIRLIGHERVGGSRVGPHERDMVTHVLSPVWFARDLPRRKDGAK